MSRLFVYVLLALALLSGNAWAASEKSMRDMYRDISEFTKKLNAEQTRHFYLLYNNYNMIQNVAMVRQDVSRAIDSCSDNNPQMEDKLRKRFKGWTDEVDPLLQEARLTLDSMVAKQTYATPERMQEVFKLVDDTRDETTSDIEKIPVSTPEACDYLIVKLDNTEQGLSDMLQSTLIDYPSSLPEDGAVPHESGLDIQPPKNSKNQ